MVASATEEAIYEALGMQFIAPELREGRGEIERASKISRSGSSGTRICAVSSTLTPLLPTGRKRWR